MVEKALLVGLVVLLCVASTCTASRGVANGPREHLSRVQQGAMPTTTDEPLTAKEQAEAELPGKLTGDSQHQEARTQNDIYYDSLLQRSSEEVAEKQAFSATLKDKATDMSAEAKQDDLPFDESAVVDSDDAIDADTGDSASIIQPWESPNENGDPRVVGSEREVPAEVAAAASFLEEDSAAPEPVEVPKSKADMIDIDDPDYEVEMNNDEDSFIVYGTPSELEEQNKLEDKSFLHAEDTSADPVSVIQHDDAPVSEVEK